MKRILILGAGNAQIDAIRYCHEKGYIVHGCSYTNTDSGIPLLDFFVQLDIKDIEGIKSYVRNQKIDVIYSVGSDLAIPTVMAVSEELDLPHFITYETACLCQAKHEMREALGDDFEGNVPFIVCSKLEEALTYSQFPGMMKPVDSQGQRGCFRVNSLDEIRQYFDDSLSFSTQKKVIIEKYVDGPEISVNAFVVKGKMEFSIISDRIVFDEFPGGIIKEHLLPTQYNESVEEIEELAGRIIEKLHIIDGPVYMQIKLDEGHPVLLEVAPRLDGCHMWNLIKHYCGVDLLGASLDYLIENQEPVFRPQMVDKKLKLAFMCEVPGEKFSREKYCCNNSLYHCWYYQTGDSVKRLNGFMEKCGYQIIEY